MHAYINLYAYMYVWVCADVVKDVEVPKCQKVKNFKCEWQK